VSGATDKTKAMVLELMQDGQTRNVRQASMDLFGKYSTAVNYCLSKLCEEGVLMRDATKETGALNFPRHFKLADQKAPDGTVDNNPFLWRTYRQYQPESRP